MIQVILLLTVTSLLSVSCTHVEPVTLCPGSAYSQTIEAASYGVIKHTMQGVSNNIDCELFLTGHPYQTPLALTNIVRNTSCYSNETTNIYVNGERFCIREDVTSLEVVPFDVSERVNITINGLEEGFTLEFYIAVRICDGHSSVTEVRNTTDWTRLYISQGYEPLANYFPFDLDCYMTFSNPFGYAIKYELVLSDIETWPAPPYYIYGLFNPRVKYNIEITESDTIDINFNSIYRYTREKFFVRYHVLDCGTPPTIRNGYYEDLPPSPYPTGTKANILCYNGYTQYNETQPYYIVCELIEEQVRWTVSTEDPYICIPAVIGTNLPPDIQNSFYVLSEDKLSATYRCIANTGNENGSETWLRDSNGGWIRLGSSIDCPATCPELEEIDNGVVLSYEPDKVYVHPDTLYYECDEGFMLFRKKITCQRNGSWSATPICIALDDMLNKVPTGLVVALAISLAIIVAEVLVCLIMWRKGMWKWTGQKPNSLNQQTTLSELETDLQVETSSAGAQNNVDVYENVGKTSSRSDSGQDNVYERVQKEPDQHTYESMSM